VSELEKLIENLNFNFKIQNKKSFLKSKISSLEKNSLNLIYVQFKINKNILS